MFDFQDLKKHWGNIHPLMIILFLGVLHGGVYVFLIPPWQHYDEPTHFEYAWWIANTGSVPKSGDYDSGMRRELAASMMEHNFFRNLPTPNLLLDQPWIGISQSEDQPLYYLITAIPLWLLRGTEMTTQLYAARFISLGMFLLTVIFSFLITVAIFPFIRALHWLFPLALVLNPAFVDLMTAVNNDVGATLFFSIFLWAGTIILMRGINFSRVVFLVLMIIICYYTKNTAFLAIPTGIFLLLLHVFQLQSPWHRLAIPGIAIFIIAISLYFFSWKDAAYWYREQVSVQQQVPTRFRTQDGNNTLFIAFSPDDKREIILTQPLVSGAIDSLAGKTYSLGAWIWASERVQIQLPTLSIDGSKTFQTAELTQTPTFFAQTGLLPKQSTYVYVLIDPLARPLDYPVEIYFDDFILVKGEYPTNQLSELTKHHTSEIGNKEEIVNLIRNPSIDMTWLTFTPFIQAQIETNIPLYALPAIQDYPLTKTMYRNTLTNLFESYWARFGWNHVTLPKFFYPLLLGFSLIGVLGNLELTGRLKQANRKVILVMVWLLICTILVWIAALARQNLPFWNTPAFTPSARYAFPVILPTSMFLISGWYLISLHLNKYRILSYLPIAFLAILDITSLIVILQFYHLT